MNKFFKYKSILAFFFLAVSYGQMNHSVKFDYMSGYAVSNASSESIFGDNYTFTVEAWYKNDGVDSGNNQGYDDGANIVSSYKRSGGGDPYNNFSLAMIPHGNPGTISMSGGAVSTDRYDDGEWHHIVGIFDKISDNEARSILYIDGEFISENFTNETDRINSYNNIYINNHSPFAGDHMLDCSLAGMRISTGVRYTENFNPSFPFITDDETIFNLDFSSGQGTSLNDLSSNGHDFTIQGSATWSDDVPSLENDSDYAVGSLGPAGGFVVYDKGSVTDGWRYIEIAPDGWSGNGDPTTTWGCSGSEINGADGYVLGSGMQNSIDIANDCDGDNAASISLNTEINGYGDWHLPSIDELWLMYQLFVSDNIGNYQNHYYWSSTEFSSIGALFINFGSSEVQYENIGDTNKQTYTEHFRPIRYFSGEEQNEPVYGCTDSYADNYNEDATFDDGSCTGYPDNGDYSLSFDRNSVNVGEIGDYSSQVTVMGWVRTTDDQSYHAIISGSCGNIMLTMHGGKILFGSQCSSPIQHDTYGTTEINDGEWYHVAATYDEYGGENNLKVYVNGNLEGQSTKSGQFSGATGNFAIGSASGGFEYINGNLDMVRIWNTALTQDQIQENMSSNNALVVDGLLADWKVSAGQGNILYDRSGNGNHGSIDGATWSDEVPVLPVPPEIGGNNSLIFDGVDDRVEIPHSENLNFGDNVPMSITFWTKRATDGEMHYMGKRSAQNNATFQIAGSGDVIGIGGYPPDNDWSALAITSPTTLLDSWTHVGFTFDGDKVVGYINGTAIDSADNCVLGPLSSADFMIGKLNYGAAYNGLIDEISIWNRPLSRHEIVTGMVSGYGGNETGLVGYWNFNVGEGSTLTDLSGNGNHGTINGAAWTGDAPKVGCMDPYADNYEPLANVNSRFCYGYPENGEHSLSFGASQDHVDLGSDMDSDEQFSIATWVYIDENIIPLNGQRTFINKVNSSNGNKSIFLGSYQSKIGFTVLTGEQSNIMYGSDNQNGSLGFTQTPLVPGWQHIGAVFTGDSMLVYINGELDANVVVFQNPGSVNDYDNSVWHMADVLGGSGNVGGKISSMSVWSKPLKQYEIQYLMSESPDPYSVGLMGMWKFSEGDGNLLYDHSGNGNHGVISGAVWSDQIPYQGPWYVSTQGSDDNVGSQNSPFKTIQKAIDKIGVNSPEIIVEPGVYDEKLTANNKNFILRSSSSDQGNHDGIGHENSDVIIQGNYDGSVFSLSNGQYHIEGVTIRFGRSDKGGGINTTNSQLMIANSLIESNQTAGSGSDGAGIYANNTFLNIDQTTIKNNNATNENGDPGSGAGIFITSDDSDSHLEISNCIIENNVADGGSGGGIILSSSSEIPFNAHINNSIFSGNSSARHGGAIYLSGLDYFEVLGCTFENNSASTDGGAIMAENTESSHTVINDSYFYGNSAGDTGGGLRFFNGMQDIENSVISNNHANVEGGGIKFTGSTPNINYCTIANNTSSVCAGGIVAVYEQVNIRNSIIYGNDVASLCTIQGGSFDVSYSNIEGGFEGEGNTDSEPLFCDANGNNFSLAQNSSSISAGEFGSNMGAEGIGCEAAYVNNALSFDGDGDYVDINYNENLALNNEMTISGWVKIPSNHNSWWGSVVGGYNGYGYILYAGSNSGSSNGNLWLEVRGGGNVSGTTDLRDNNWHHIAVTYDGNTARAFVDGQLEGESSFETDFQGTSGYPLKFGYVNHSVGSNEHFPGILDELSIYNIALDQQTIQSYMVSELLGYEPGLVGYWNFNEVQNSTVYDITGNGHDGTIYGAELSGDAAPIGPPPAVDGCTDPYAENYDLYANTNDGTCEYSQEPVTFTKEDYADASLEENQDRITASVWITRGDNQPLYNAAFESYSDYDVSPSGTIWAPGQTALQINTNGYQSFRNATGGNHQDLPGRIMSMYIVQEDLFYDVEFHSWTSNQNGGGGGFSYTRTPAEINSFEYPEGTVYFEKLDFDDFNLEENQDRISDRTWITRDDSRGIFNVLSEEGYDFSYDDEQEVGPSNTLWAYGLTDYVEGEYRPFKEAVQNQMSMSSLNDGGHTFSMHIVSENLFYDVEFHSWTSQQNGGGGGFSYTRTDQNGESVTFTKEDYANHTLEENQDRITNSVWITRGNDHPLFNIAAESSYESAILYTNVVGSPENTEWSYGRTSDLVLDSYQPWQAAIGGTNPRNAIGRFMSMHLIEEDLYYDIIFHSWTCCANGGGFSYTRMPASPDSEQMLNGKLVGLIESASDNSPLEGAHIIAIAEDESYSAETFSDVNGEYNMDLLGSLNYFVTVSYEGLIDHNQYIYVAPFEDTYINVSLGVLEDAMVEGTVTDWYTNVPLANASVLLAYTDEEMVTIESTTDENGYFMVQVPGEEDYDLFVYSDGYWVEHDAFYLSSGEHQVLSVGIAEMSAASRLYGTIRDFDTDELIPYAAVQLNCEQASDWDHTGELGTYRVFSYYPDDCDDGVLIVAADGYETSVQSVGNIEFESGSSYDLDIALVQGNDPDPGMLSGTVYSNIDGNAVGGADITAYNVNTTQLFSVETLDDGSYQIFLPESDYYVSVTADNHEEYLDTLSIISGQSSTLDFNLDEMYLNTVSGVITDLSGNGLFDMEVYVIPAGESYAINSTFSNENGEYSLQVPNGLYDFGAGSNGYFMNFEYGVELSGNDQAIDFTLTPVSEFDGGIAGIVHLNDGDNSTVWINVWNSVLTYQAYISPDENGAYTLPLVNGEYSMYAWVPGSDYEPVFIPGAFTIEDNVINYDIYFVAPDSPEAPTIVFLEDVPNDQGGQLELAWTPGEPMEYEIFPQYSVWRMEDGWNLIATVPYHGFDLYNMIVPTQGDSTADGIFESTFMVTAHTLDQNTFFDSDPLTGYSVDNIFPGIPQQLVATFQGESVDLEWNISEAEDLSHYNVYRQNQSLEESAFVFVSENNFYSDNVGIDGDFQYWVTAVDLSGNESDASEPAMVTLGIVEEVLPLEFSLLQNYPNPFNPSTQIMYTLPKTSSVKIVIYDMLGSKVRTLFSGSQGAGYKNVLWNATNDQGDPVSAGMYIYTIEAESFFASKKMILLK